MSSWDELDKIKWIEYNLAELERDIKEAIIKFDDIRDEALDLSRIIGSMHDLTKYMITRLEEEKKKHKKKGNGAP